MTERDLVLELPNDIRSIQHAVEYVMHRCAACIECDRKLRLNFRVSLMEALSNAMLYGNREDPRKRVRLELSFDACTIRACVTDQGAGFDPGAVPDPTEPENLCKPGGRGLFLMRELLDEVHYNDRGNSVTLVMRLQDTGDAPGLDSAARA